MDVCKMHDIKYTAVIDSHVGNRGIPWKIPTENQFTHDAHPLNYFVTKTSI